MNDERLIILLSFSVLFTLILGILILVGIVSVGRVTAETSAGQDKLLHTLEILTAVWIGGMVQRFLSIKKDKEP